jgi:uncharacterized protein YjgD (DUF1641 family)
MNKTDAFLRQSFREMAARLPELAELDALGNQKTELRSILGQSFINAGITKTKNGEVIRANKYYAARVPVMVDHYRNIKSLYEREGQTAVELYILKVQEKSTPTESTEGAAINNNLK